MFGNKIKKIMDKRKVSVETLSDVTKINKDILLEILEDEIEPNFTQINMIMKFLEINPNKVFYSEYHNEIFNKVSIFKTMFILSFVLLITSFVLLYFNNIMFSNNYSVFLNYLILSTAEKVLIWRFLFFLPGLILFVFPLIFIGIEKCIKNNRQ